MTPEQIEAYVDAAAAAMQLPLTADHRPGVLRYFALAASMADTLDADALRLHDDSAETFLAVEPKLTDLPEPEVPTSPAGTPGPPVGSEPR